MKIEEISIEGTVIKFFDDYIEDEEAVLRDVEVVLQREIAKYEEDICNVNDENNCTHSCNLSQSQL